MQNKCRPSTSANSSRSCCWRFCAWAIRPMASRSSRKSRSARGGALRWARCMRRSTGWRRRAWCTPGLPIRRRSGAGGRSGISRCCRQAWRRWRNRRRRSIACGTASSGKENPVAENPPRMAEALIRWLVGGRDADAVAGDLREQFADRGRLWYWRQALSCAAVRLSPHRRMLPGLGMDFHHALRTIRRSPGYAVTAMVCLGLAMGVNTTLFALLDSIYFRRLPVAEPDRVVKIEREKNPLCYWREYVDFRGSLRSMQTTAWGSLFADDALIGTTRVHTTAEMVSADFAGVLRVGTAAGRWFTPADDSPSSLPSVVISYAFWKAHWNSDPAAVGSDLMTDAGKYRIIG